MTNYSDTLQAWTLQGQGVVDGPILPSIPELHQDILSPSSAVFVDVIHTNGALKPVAVSLEVVERDVKKIITVSILAKAGCSSTTWTPGLLPRWWLCPAGLPAWY